MLFLNNKKFNIPYTTAIFIFALFFLLSAQSVYAPLFQKDIASAGQLISTDIDYIVDPDSEAQYVGGAGDGWFVASSVITQMPALTETTYVWNDIADGTMQYAGGTGDGWAVNTSSSTDFGPLNIFTWNGLGADNNCSTVGNWDKNVVPNVGSIIVFDGTSTKNITWDAGCPSTVASLAMNAGYTGTLNLDGQNLTVAGTFTVNSGTLKLQGDETVSTPTLNNGSTVEYTGATLPAIATIKNWSYKTLSITGAGKEYDFTAGATYTVATAFNATGLVGSFAQLRSTSAGTMWNMAIPATRSFNYLDVKDSNNTGTEVDARGTTFTNSGNNAGWLFNQTPNVPTLVSPANASFTSDTTPTLSANYSDPDTADTGTTNYRISTSSLADCTANTNVIAWGTSDPATSDENENTSITVTAGQALTSDATYYWCAQNNDGTATSSWTAMGSFTLDTATPTTTATAGSYTFGNLSIPDVTVTLSCSDGLGSGCLTTYYCISENDTCTPNTVYTNPVSVGSTGYIRYYSTDSNSNNESISSKVVRITSGGGGGLSTPTTSTSAESSGETKQPNIVEQIISIPQQIVENVVQQITNVFNPQTSPEEGVVLYPPIEQAVPLVPQLAFDGWEVLKPAPQGFANVVEEVVPNFDFFAKRLPEFNEAMKSLGVNTVEDAGKISGFDLNLSGITQTYLSGSGFTVQSMGLENGQGIPVAQFSAKDVEKIPSDIVFAQSVDGAIDYSIKLTFDSEGIATQQINIVSGRKVELIMKTSSEAKRVLGFLVMKNSKSASVEEKNPFLANLLSAITDSAQTVSESIKTGLLLQKFEYERIENGLYRANITAPVVDGEYEIITITEYKNTEIAPKETRLIAVVDPEGYVYEKIGKKQARVVNAKVSIFWLSPETNVYELWPSEKFIQTNPQVTNETGKYSFLVPQGMYYLTAEADGYFSYKSAPFSVQQDIGVHMNIELKEKSWLPNWGVPWQAIIAITLIILTIVIILFAFITWKSKNQHLS